jgi:phage anti-repressor protein
MNTLIKQETVNFHTLVTTNCANTNLNFQSKLIDELNTTFTENEQKWYIANLYMYLNYHPTNDFPINLDDVYKMIGFAHKKNAKRTLENNFTENEDYINVNLLLRTQKQDCVNNHGGNNKETIMLNVDTFKNICMMTKTDKAKEIRKYYVKLENIYNKLINEEHKQHQLELQEKESELKDVKKQLEINVKLNMKKLYNAKQCECVYAYKNNSEDDPYIKISKAENIKKREDSYMVGNRNSTIFYYRPCYNSKLTEKVIHHILDKHRIQNNKEWFEISEKLAIYTIDLVCDFLDGYIGYSEELINLQVKEQLSISINKIKEMTNNQNESNADQDDNDNIQNNSKRKKIKKIIEQKDELKLHFDKFVKEYCELGDDKKCIALDILGAYRMWNRKTDTFTRQNLTTYLKNNFDIKHEFSSEYNTKFHYYIGIKPKDFIIKRESMDRLPYYEEFVLSECKFDYTYRTTKAILYNEFKEWVSKKYPDYIFSKQDHIHMESYLNRTFCNCRKVHINGGTNGYYGIQLKSDPNEVVGMVLSKRKKVYKINIITKKIMETYDSLYIAAQNLDLDEKKLSVLVLNNTIIDDTYMYSYNQQFYKKT